MTIKIVLPEGEGVRSTMGTRVYTDSGHKSTVGIRVYTDSGHEIEGITRIQCDWRADEILEATITVELSEIENLDGIEGIVIAEPEEDGDR